MESSPTSVPPVLIDRVTTLDALARESTQSLPFRFRGTLQNLPTVRVRLDFPVFRIGNHRTKTLQEEYLANHPDLPADFFQVDQDSDAVQSAQFEILEKLVNDQELLETFKKDGTEQEEPILCTREGVVVNGNRRLCAWRKLHAEDPVQYRRFESVQVILLPSDCTEEDIDNIERDLQIKKTHRAAYSWHTKAAMIKEAIDKTNLDKNRLAALFDMKPAEVDMAIACYEYARQHLVNIGHPGEWSRVDKDDFAFRRIVESEKKIRNEGQKEVFNACSAALLQASPESVGNRKYDVIPRLAENIQAVVEVVEKELLPPDDGERPQLRAMKAARECRKPENLAQTVELVKSVIDAARDKEKDEEKGLALLSALKDVATRLLTVKTADLDERQKELAASRKQLESIFDSATFIKEWLDRHENPS